MNKRDRNHDILKRLHGANLRIKLFDKKEMVDWENKHVNIKDDYDKAKLYFEGLVRDFETYTQNSGGNSGKRGYESANQMADVGDEIQKYIQEIASASVTSNE